MNELKQHHRYQTFHEFWPYYLSEHKQALTRFFHLIGILSIFIFLFLAYFRQEPYLLLLTPLIAYGPAWFSHFFIEKNKPATFQYPLWSLIADFKMCYLICTRQIEREFQKINKTLN